MTETQAWIQWSVGLQSDDMFKFQPKTFLQSSKQFYFVLFSKFCELHLVKSQFERMLFKNVIIMINGKTSKSEQCLNDV